MTRDDLETVRYRIYVNTVTYWLSTGTEIEWYRNR